MDLKGQQTTWEKFAKEDPLWAILTDPTKKGGRWERDEFFQTGRNEIAAVMQYIDSLKLKAPLQKGRSLDFGCGVGRLTQALCLHFAECTGIDIAPTMIKLANTYNQYGEKCRYYVNESNDLRLFEDNRFDFVYSNIVLQHMEPKYSKNYIREFLRVLAPGGVVIFQLPGESLMNDRSAISDALPHSAFKARITLLNSLHHHQLRATSQLTLRVRVKNESEVIWPTFGADATGKYQIKLGNHWLDHSGNIVVNDDGRTPLPKDLHPMDEVDLSLTITAPPEAGQYIVELDMVQEEVAWFRDTGSQTARIQVDVRKKKHLWLLNLFYKILPKNRMTFSSTSLVMDMYHVDKEEVVEFIKENGGIVVDIQENNVAGEGWRSFSYCVTKSV